MVRLKAGEIQKKVFGDDLHFSLEHRLLLFSLVMGVFMGVLGTATNLFLSDSFLAMIIPFVLALAIAVLYYFVRFKNRFKSLSIVSSVLGIIGVSIVWVFNGGINGPNTMVSFSILVLALSIVSNKVKVYIIILFISVNIFILLIQIYRPSLIVGYNSEISRWIDHIICLIYSSFFIFLIIRFIHKHYTIEKQRAEENEKKIQQKNDELQKLNSDKDLFMQILAHDLKNPFSSIIGFSDLLLRNARTYSIEKIEDQLGILNQVTQNTFNLLEDLLLWSKSTTGKLNAEPQRVAFNQVFDEVMKNLSQQAQAKEISVSYSESEAVVLLADANMLKTILRNLISNAIKFTYKQGTIKVLAEITDKNAIISIADNGIGIEKGVQDQLWNLAHPYSTQGTDDEQGTGLGLLLCKEFVSKNKGEIWVESELKKGSVFKFTIPLYEV